MTNDKIRERVGSKPGSVLFVEGGYLSGTPVTRCLKRLLFAELVKDQP